MIVLLSWWYKLLRCQHNSLQLNWITQPENNYIADAAYGVVGRTLYILGGIDNSLRETDKTTTFDLDSLTFTTLSEVVAPEAFELWSMTTVTVGNEIYFTGRQSSTFWKFNTQRLNYTELESIPDGWGLGCLATGHPTGNVSYIYQLGGTATGWSDLDTIYVCIIYVVL